MEERSRDSATAVRSLLERKASVMPTRGMIELNHAVRAVMAAANDHARHAPYANANTRRR